MGFKFALRSLLEAGVITEVLRDRVYTTVYSLKEGDKVIDVGARIGVFTVMAAKEVGEKGKVIAIEPEPKNAALLLENLRLNEIKNVILIEKAASDKRGHSPFTFLNSAAHIRYSLPRQA